MNPGESVSTTTKLTNTPQVENQTPTIIEEIVTLESGLTNSVRWVKGKFLGKGGFAKCYEMNEPVKNTLNAVKVIPKNMLTKDRAKQKLQSEIKIHKSLKHKNIVEFKHVFEDNDNVYIIMELCPNQTLNELAKRRINLTDIEVRFYLSQICSAFIYLQEKRIIHRDLKLSNLFLNDKLEVKLGDFGLAAQLSFEGERRKTICGTPNYISPEILEGKGHSYEVDIWSLGVIAYVLIIGKPPFESPDVKATYRKIRNVQFTIPENFPITEEAKSLIKDILQLDPAKRPSFKDILAHPFMTSGPIPETLPIVTLACPPTSSWMKHVMAPKNSGPMRATSHGKLANAGAEPHSANPYHQSKFAPVRVTLQLNRPDTADKESTSAKKQIINLGYSSTRNNQRSEIDQSRQSNGTRRLISTDTIAMNMINDMAINLKPNPLSKSIENEVYVVRWKDMTAKFGVGYILSNKSIGVFFNDTTKIVLHPRGTYYEYYEKTADKIDLLSRHNYADPPPPELKKKVVILTSFKKALEKGSDEMKKAPQTPGSTGIMEVPGEFTTATSETAEESTYLPFVKKWTNTKLAYLFRLNNKLVQIVFSDMTQILMSSHHKKIVYVNKKGDKTTHDMATVMESEHKEMVRRMRYAKELVGVMMGKETKTKEPARPTRAMSQQRIGHSQMEESKNGG